MKIWIDADSSPVLVRNFVVLWCKKNNSQCFFVANHEIPIKNHECAKMIVCEKIKDSADNYIFQNAMQDDLVITNDLLFANKLIQKNIRVINDRGKEFTKSNIEDLLYDRQFDLQIAETGLVKNFYEGYQKEKYNKFKECFFKTVSQMKN